MKTAQRTLFAARHAFLKHGYLVTTLKKIAQYANTSTEMIRYHYGTKEKLFKIVFIDFLDLLLEQLKHDELIPVEEDFQKRKIEYPDVFEVAWFVANEFHTNSDKIYQILKDNPHTVKQMHSIHKNSRLKENFEKLIRVNVSMIMQRNVLRLG